MMNPDVLLSEQSQIVLGLAPVVPSSTTPRYVSMKNYSKLTVIINQLNLASGMTGSAITMKQATNVGAAGEKALSFTTMRANLNTSATDTLVDTAVASNTFTTDATASTNSQYEITIDQTLLDITNNFDCVRVGTANATNSTLSVVYILWPAKYGKTTPPSAILD